MSNGDGAVAEPADDAAAAAVAGRGTYIVTAAAAAAAASPGAGCWCPKYTFSLALSCAGEPWMVYRASSAS